ncbi:MAG: 50S ribosomal protein L30 [Spirochaetes bacterium GWD1_27_9]|nr:MAG: 50S ribosomal protein L30 [Spirochaetes bacterium GWB1_27_13]OHD21038.1 MAG: 50S ribosomal protein L30 [Spirochaetes bacterium GWC1_27_15]OHD45399.1 MAG: 50S ribosomal protein L30 [Spirochaetes bacterium GWD1_27_9]
MAKIKVKLVRSYYGCKDDQINTVRSLGLRKINQVREHDDNPILRGMIFKVKHLVELV